MRLRPRATRLPSRKDGCRNGDCARLHGLSACGCFTPQAVPGCGLCCTSVGGTCYRCRCQPLQQAWDLSAHRVSCVPLLPAPRRPAETNKIEAAKFGTIHSLARMLEAAEAPLMQEAAAAALGNLAANSSEAQALIASAGGQRGRASASRPVALAGRASACRLAGVLLCSPRSVLLGLLAKACCGVGRPAFCWACLQTQHKHLSATASQAPSPCLLVCCAAALLRPSSMPHAPSATSVRGLLACFGVKSDRKGGAGAGRSRADHALARAACRPHVFP